MPNQPGVPRDSAAMKIITASEATGWRCDKRWSALRCLYSEIHHYAETLGDRYYVSVHSFRLLTRPELREIVRIQAHTTPLSLTHIFVTL